MSEVKSVANEKTMSLIEHLEELRSVLIVSLIAVLGGAVIAYFFHEDLLAILTKPLTDTGFKPVIIRATEGFFAAIKVSLFGGLIIASPVIFFKIWSFVLPALYEHERKWVYYLLPPSVILFVTGILFAYFTVFQIGVKFLIGFGDFNPMISIGEFIGFAFMFLLPFGIVFQLPLFIVFSVKTGLVNLETLQKGRKYALLLSFVVAAVLTPTPDIISQVLMAGPMYVMYEGGILVGRFVKPKKKESEADVEERTETNLIGNGEKSESDHS